MYLGIMGNCLMKKPATKISSHFKTRSKAETDALLRFLQLIVFCYCSKKKINIVSILRAPTMEENPLTGLSC